MKKIYFVCGCMIFLSFYSSGQQINTKKVNETKYRIDLPDYWGKGNKVWGVLMDKLPLACPELKDKDLCGDDCSPAYTIDFYMTGPEIISYSGYRVPQVASTNTRAVVSQMPNITQNPVNIPQRNINEHLPQIQQQEPLKLITEYRFQCFLLLRDAKDSLITKIILVDTNELWQFEYKGRLEDRFSSFQNTENIIEKNIEKLMPTRFDMFAIVDKKILTL